MVPDDFIARVLDVLEGNLRITPMLLTKRTDRMANFLGKRWGSTPPSHICVGASAGNQQLYDQRRAGLEATPAALRFWSLEPLLSPIDLKDPKGIDQVIIGGESGSSRGCEIGWIRELVSQCRTHGVAPFVKQLGSVQARQLGCFGLREGPEQGAGHDDLARRPSGSRVGQVAGRRAGIVSPPYRLLERTASSGPSRP
jgi:protein gp37